MKHVKMLIYGEPGIGKSVFASQFPKPFFITTDGNYEFLEDFGADPNAHAQVQSWKEAKDIFLDNFENYDTIVVDLLEDLFKWCEYEYCNKNKLEHISDLGWGKGYDITRNEFFIEICKLLNKNKHVILICHEYQYIFKDKRGVEHVTYKPSNRIPDKVMDMIEGRLRCLLRCHYETTFDENNKEITNRVLDLIPKEDEYGIIRGVNTNNYPTEIPLDANIFLETLGYTTSKNVVKRQSYKTSTVLLSEDKDSTVKEIVKTEKEVVKTDVQQTAPVITDIAAKPKVTKEVEEVKTNVEENNKVESELKVDSELKAETKVETKTETKVEQPMSQEDKLAKIKAKLAKLKNQ